MNSVRVGAVITLLAMGLALGGVGYAAAAFLDAPIEVVRIEGNLTDAERNEVRSVVMASLLETTNPENVLKWLTELGWCRDVRVRRVWPHAIHVSVTRQTLAARWGDNSYLTSSGEVVQSPATPQRRLPRLSASISDGAATMQVYQMLDGRLNEQGLRLVELTENTLGEWSVRISNGLVVLLGREDLKRRLDRFLVVYEKALAQQLSRVERVDARYEAGVAVRWRDASSPPDTLIAAVALGGK